MKFYPAWAEINLNSLDENIQAIRDEIGSNVKIAPVLKHDAFGHGAVTIAKRLMQTKNIAMFCLETVEECLALRKENIKVPLLLLSEFYEKELPLIMENNITVTIYDLEGAQELSKFAKKSGKRCSVHLRVDTDEECDGIDMDEFKEIYAQMRQIKNIKIDGIYTQIYSSYSDDEQDRITSQIEDFKTVVEEIPQKQRKSILVHAAGSECLFKYPQAYFDMVRPGMTMFYKLKSTVIKENGQRRQSFEIKPIMKIKTRVEAIYNVDREVRQCLGRLDLTESCQRVADLSIGWWDVCYLFMEKDGYAMIRDKKVRVFTSTQMDRVLIDITGVKDAHIEDEVTLLGEPDNNFADSRETLEFNNFRRILHTGERMPKRYTNWSEHAIEFPAFVLYHIRRELPKLNELLDDYGNKSLEQYLASLDVAGTEALEPKEDMAQSAYEHTLPLFGAEIAEEVKDYFTTPDCLVYTALHHGVDFDSNQIQSNLIYYRYLQRSGRSSTIVPMLSCGGVDMSSATYPRGLECYSTVTPKTDNDMEVFRLPIFDNRYSNMVVYDTPSYTKEMVEKVIDALMKDETRAFLKEPVLDVFLSVLKNDYLDPYIIKQDSYAKQASLLNHRIQKGFIDGKTSPDFIYLQMEDIVTDLIIKDIQKETSLTWKILFNDKVRREVAAQLDGETGCWTKTALEHMIQNPQEKSTVRHHGSYFFWGINSSKKRVPLLLEEHEGKPYLITVSGGEETEKWLLSPENISFLLKEKRIYPGVFMIMFMLKFVRGFALAGGCFQIEYTKKMKTGLCKALRKFSKLQDTAEQINFAMDDHYINGPMFGLVEDAFGGYVQAGPAEILARGGIKENEFHKLLNISFHDAAMIGTLTMYSDVFAQKDRMKNWHSELSGGLEKLYQQICLS